MRRLASAATSGPEHVGQYWIATTDGRRRRVARARSLRRRRRRSRRCRPSACRAPICPTPRRRSQPRSRTNIRRVGPVSIVADAWVISGSRFLQVPQPMRPSSPRDRADSRAPGPSTKPSSSSEESDRVALYIPASRRRRQTIVFVVAALVVGSILGVIAGRASQPSVTDRVHSVQEKARADRGLDCVCCRCTRKREQRRTRTAGNGGADLVLSRTRDELQARVRRRSVARRRRAQAVARRARRARRADRPHIAGIRDRRRTRSRRRSKPHSGVSPMISRGSPRRRGSTPNMTNAMNAPIRIARSGKPSTHLVTDEDRECVGRHHPEGRSCPHGEQVLRSSRA